MSESENNVAAEARPNRVGRALLDGLRWVVVLALVAGVTLLWRDSQSGRRAFWIDIFHSLLSKPTEENFGELTDRVAAEITNEYEFEFFYRQVLLETFWSVIEWEELEGEPPPAGFEFDRMRRAQLLREEISHIEALGFSERYLRLKDLRNRAAIEGLERWNALRGTTESPTFAAGENAGLAIESARRAVSEPTFPMNEVLSPDDFAARVEAALFLRDLERHMLLFNETVDLRVTMSYPVSMKQPDMEWNLLSMGQPFGLEDERYRSVCSRNIADRIYEDTFRDGLAAWLKSLESVDEGTPLPLSLSVTAHFPGDTFQLVAQGFMLDGEFHCQKALPRPAEWERYAQLADARLVKQPPEDLVERLKSDLRLQRADNANSPCELGELLVRHPRLRELLGLYAGLIEDPNRSALPQAPAIQNHRADVRYVREFNMRQAETRALIAETGLTLPRDPQSQPQPQTQTNDSPTSGPQTFREFLAAIDKLIEHSEKSL